MSQSSSTSSGGIGFSGALTILFIGLKLTHTIAWSWWWVLSPLWLPLAIILPIVGLAYLAIKVFYDLRDVWQDRQRIKKAGERL